MFKKPQSVAFCIFGLLKSHKTPKTMKRTAYLSLVILVLFCTVMLFMQNGELVGVKFLLWRWESTLAMFSILSFSSGMLLSLILTLPAWLKKRAEVKRIQQELQTLYIESLHAKVASESQSENISSLE